MITAVSLSLFAVTTYSLKAGSRCRRVSSARASRASATENSARYLSEKSTAAACAACRLGSQSVSNHAASTAEPLRHGSHPLPRAFCCRCMHSIASGGAKENCRRRALLDAGAGADAVGAFEDGGVAPASTVTPLFELLLLLKSGIARANRAPPESAQRLVL